MNRNAPAQTLSTRLPASICDCEFRFREAGFELLHQFGGSHHFDSLARTSSTVPASTSDTYGTAHRGEYCIATRLAP